MRRIMRRPEVEAATGLRRTRLDELERAGKFPKRIRISERATGWRSDEIEQWIDSRPLAEDVDSDLGDQLRATSREHRALGSLVRAARAKERAQ